MTSSSSPDGLSHDRLLDRLGEVAVRTGLNVAPGQQVLITAPLDAVPLVRKIAEHAYRAGSSLVTPFYADDAVTLARFHYAPDAAFHLPPTWLHYGLANAHPAGAARLALSGRNPVLPSEADPARLASVPPTHLHAH